MNLLCYYCRWDDGALHCVSYELQSVQVARMRNDEENVIWKAPTSTWTSLDRTAGKGYYMLVFHFLPQWVMFKLILTFFVSHCLDNMLWWVVTSVISSSISRLQFSAPNFSTGLALSHMTCAASVTGLCQFQIEITGTQCWDSGFKIDFCVIVTIHAVLVGEHVLFGLGCVWWKWEFHIDENRSHYTLGCVLSCLLKKTGWTNVKGIWEGLRGWMLTINPGTLCYVAIFIEEGTARSSKFVVLTWFCFPYWI